MPSIVADRFVITGAAWIDLATGDAVRLRTRATGGRRADLVWCSRCDALARLRHPILCPLIDYGAIDAATMFEAYAMLPPLRASAATVRRFRQHARQFLHTHGADVDAETWPSLLRQHVEAPSRRIRSIGLVLQPRCADRAVADFLDAAVPGGPALLTIAGEHGAGLTTVRLAAARAARSRGYTPVAARVLAMWPSIVSELLARHVCVLFDEASEHSARPAIADLLAALGRTSTRRHAVLTFSRHLQPHCLHLDPLGVTAMTAMVYGDGQGPSPSERFDAARRAHGKPGLFLEHLDASNVETHRSGASFVHEAAHPYVIDAARAAAASVLRPKPARGVVLRALDRAEALVARRRHSAAMRLLDRAVRVLSARGDHATAGRCAERLGHLWLRRGNTAAAIAAFERARTAARGGLDERRASCELARAWLEDARFAQAEALLRSLAASAAVEQAAVGPEVACALARALFWQSRYDEALELLRSHCQEQPDVRCLAVAARAHAAAGRSADAIRLARRAVDAAASRDHEAVAIAYRSLAAALAAAGDPAGGVHAIQTALPAARRARLPLLVIRVRLTMLHVAALAGDTRAVRRLVARLSALAGRSVTPLVAMQIEQAVAAARDSRHVERTAFTISDLEHLLQICQASPDDQQALDRICEAVSTSTRAASVVIVSASDRRLIGRDGRAWHDESPAVARALLTGSDVFVDGTDGRFEAAEPVRYGGEVVAALAVRWIGAHGGSSVRSILKAAALAASAPARAVLDRTLPQAPDPVWHDLLGDSPSAVALREATARAARAPFPVLIEGESGSGKELVARAIHRLSPRRDRRFCAVNCAALTDDLLEAELFGHARGAFTGAVGERLGLFEEADGGTLFLDEIGELSPRGQAKLLRVLQEGEIRRVGESFPRRIDVRVVAATNRRLHEEAEAGRFRLDLRFRLDVVRIVVPPLRERATDVPLLAAHFWNDASSRVGSRATLSPETLAALARYDWPGNVRELQNVIAWMAVHSPRRGRIGADGLPTSVAGPSSIAPITFEAAREDFERRFIRTALARANGQRAQAAASIGISRQGLIKMMRRLRIDDRTVA
jgi:DNA-binding NtrC family response regulator/tetratricopeptide (TPR) repeat protein